MGIPEREVLSWDDLDRALFRLLEDNLRMKYVEIIKCPGLRSLEAYMDYPEFPPPFLSLPPQGLVSDPVKICSVNLKSLAALPATGSPARRQTVPPKKRSATRKIVTIFLFIC